MRYAIGVDLGGTNIKAASVSERGQVLDRAGAPTQDAASERPWVEVIRGLIAQLEGRRGAPPAGIGIGAPGVAARDGRSIAAMKGRMAGLQGLDWPRTLGTPAPVRVLNDAHAALLAEAWTGAAAGLRDVVLLTLGTGVGGAILVDGRLVLGGHGKAAHWGHFSLDPDGAPSPVTGMPGAFEDTIGNASLEARSGGRFRDTRALVDAHRAGDAEATRVWLRSVHRLAVAIASIANVLDPEAIVVGGGIARAGDALFAPLSAYLDEVEWRPQGERTQVRPAALGEEAGAIGAARAVLGADGSGGGPQERYLEGARGIVGTVAAQRDAIAEAADWFAGAILAGRMVHVFGAGHSRIMVEEMWPRYGSFPGFNPIVELSLTFHNPVVGANGQRQAMFLENVSGLAARILRNFHLSARDAGLVISSGGGSVVAVEMAEALKAAGMKVVALVSRRHSETSPSREARGRRVQDFADLVLDTGAPPGDAMVTVPGLETPVAPGSTVGGCLVVNAIKAEVASRLTAAGQPPAVLTAPVLAGPERSAELFESAYDEHARRLARLYAGPDRG